MRLLLTALIVAIVCCGATASLNVFGQKWDVVDESDWKVETAYRVETLELVTSRGPLPGPRRPIQFALAQTSPFSRVKIEADVRPHARSLIFVFAYRDPAHFNYAHISIDTGVAQPVHNGIFHVFGGERVRISSQAGPAAFAASNRWYHAVLQWDGQTGAVSVTIDSQPVPALHAVDLSLNSGRIGIGSFDETADFRNVRIDGSTPQP